MGIRPPTRRLADANGTGSQPREQAASIDGYGSSSVANGSSRGPGEPSSNGLQERICQRGLPSETGRAPARQAASAAGVACGLGNSATDGRVEECAVDGRSVEGSGAEVRQQRPWDDFDVVPCHDGKARRFEPGSFPLAHGISNRVGKLRAYGNAIVPQVAATFIRAFMEAIGGAA